MTRSALSGLVIAVLAAVLSACSREGDYFKPSPEESLAHAAQVMGIGIDPCHHWQTTDEVMVDIDVSMGLDQTYTVQLFNADPTADDSAVYYLQATIGEGQRYSDCITLPRALGRLFVVATDSRHRRVVKAVGRTSQQLSASLTAADAEGAVVRRQTLGRPAPWTYAFEDTYWGDYDLNDVVIRVSDHPSDASRLDVTLCCVGASLDLTVWLGDQQLFADPSAGGVSGGEVHDVFAARLGAKGSSVLKGRFVNTVGADGLSASPVTVTIGKPSGFTFGTAPFRIRSILGAFGSQGGYIGLSGPGDDPHGLLIPCVDGTDWQWPLEHVHVGRAYPAFARYAGDAASTAPESLSWYAGSTPGHVFVCLMK